VRTIVLVALASWSSNLAFADVCARSVLYPEAGPRSVAATDWVIDHPELCAECGGGGKTIDQLDVVPSTDPDAAGVCRVSRRDGLEAAIRLERTRAPARAGRWDHASAVAFRDQAEAVLAITPAEDARLARDGFVVPARLDYADYASAYYDVHRAQLPVYVSADSIMHAIHASHDQLLARLETDRLTTRLDDALGRMACGLPDVARSFPPEVARDLDVYLTVARDLLADTELPAALGPDQDETIAKLVGAAHDGEPITIELFGRERTFDGSQFVPRGHYADELGMTLLPRYFRAAMWLSRLEFNLVSRDCRSSQPGFLLDPSETPREAVDALALADLADRTGALTDLAEIDRAWSGFAGHREDVSLAQLVALRKTAGIGKLTIPDSANRLRAAIGSSFRRTVNTSEMPDVNNLPVIATALGARVTPDLAALARLPDAPPEVRGAEVAYALGNARAASYLHDVDMTEVEAGRAVMSHAAAGGDLYAAWLRAIQALAAPASDRAASFMTTPAFADLQLDSTLVAYGQLRHNHVLVTAHLYDVGGCEIPDGYVEPVPAVYGALADWAARGDRVFATLDPGDHTGGRAYFQRAERVLRTLQTIARDELAGRALTTEQRTWLAMIVEERDASAWDYSGSFPVPTYNGWYLDLFPNSETAFRAAAFIADTTTHVHETAAWIDYLGANGPHLGLFVVDTGGAPRLMVGPVADGYAAAGPFAKPFTDQTARDAHGVAPWQASYAVAAAPEPRLAVEIQGTARVAIKARGVLGPRAPKLAPGTIELDAASALGDVTIELRDHHFAKLHAITVRVPAGHSEVRLAHPEAVESMLVRVGEFAGRVDLGLDGHGARGFGGATTGGRDSRGSRSDDAP